MVYQSGSVSVKTYRTAENRSTARLAPGNSCRSPLLLPAREEAGHDAIERKTPGARDGERYSSQQVEGRQLEGVALGHLRVNGDRHADCDHHGRPACEETESEQDC